MNRRREFLEALFRRLNDAGIGFCVSRNGAEVFVEGDSDVDLVVLPRDEGNVIKLADAACEQTGFQRVFQTRFTNLCLLYHGGGDYFVRIDVDSGIRWRVFPVIRAADMLADRVACDGFWMPSARSEILVLVAKVAWMGKISERYRSRLEELNAKSPTTGEQKRLMDLALAGDAAGIKRVLATRALRSPAGLLATTGYVWGDIVRVASRLISPPGVYLGSCGTRTPDAEKLLDLLSMAFPTKKSCLFEAGDPPKKALLSLFRAGLVFDRRCLKASTHPVPRVAFLGCLAKSANRFEVFIPGNGIAYFAHHSSGVMRELDAENGLEENLAAGIAEGMARTLGKKQVYPRGKFVVLVGLDGAGKTTFARKFAGRLANDPRCRGIRYFHWIPTLFGNQFPWPSFKETPRKAPTEGGVQAILSVVRLCKNLASARLVYHTRLLPCLRQGKHVVVDRFLYNYWLDPVSLCYNGPKLALKFAEWAMPKPDFLLSLEAEAETLLSRKQELTPAEIERQKLLLAALPMRGVQKVVLDARLSPEALVEKAISTLGL